MSRLLGKTKQNSNVEKKLKTKLQGTFSLFYVVFRVQQFKAVQLFKLELKISFCTVCPFREAVILKGQFLTIF